MEVLYPCCAGLDVHKKTVQACVRRVGPGGQVRAQTRQFGTMTGELLALGDWLAQQQVSHVAMESTGVLWKPIWNLLEGHFELVLCNARAVKQVPGRKTDVKDCQWLAHLMQCGLLKPSFVPDRPLRELRDLTRQRVQLVKEHTSVANRLQKVLEDANIKLSCVASDVLGVSGRDMIRALIAGEQDPQALADLARRRLRQKLPQLAAALEGQVDEHHRFLLQMYMDHLAHLEALIARLEARLEQVLASEALQETAGGDGVVPFPEAVRLLTTIPGVDKCTAQAILAETGTDMSRFPSADHLCSWAGVCPGNNESAGKRRSAKTPPGNRWLKRSLTQAAWAASRTKDTYLSALYRRLCARRGKKRAIVAVAHSILAAVYYMLSRHEAYQEAGGAYLDRLHPERLARSLTKRLEALGYSVLLEPLQQAA